ncbi:autotransporter-associated beta strand repeat-containing protein [Xanthobacteraceae bacterium A53D]
MNAARSRAAHWRLFAGVSLLATAASLSATKPAQACFSITTFNVYGGSTACVDWTGGDLILTNTGLMSGGTFSPGTIVGLRAATPGTALENDGTITVTGATITTTGTTVAGLLSLGTITTLTNTNRIGASGTIGLFAGFNNLIAGVANTDALSRIGTLANSGTISAGGSIAASGVVPGGSAPNVIAGVANMSGTIGSLSNTGLISVAGSAADGLSGLSAIFNRSVIETLSNLAGGQITSTITTGSHYAIGIHNYNGGTIGNLLNDAGATISGGTAIVNRGSIGTITNNGMISTRDGILAREGTIDSLINNGTIAATLRSALSVGVGASAVSVLNGSDGFMSGTHAMGNGGTIGTLTNSGTLSGIYAGIGNSPYGSIGSIDNSGSISGNEAIANDGFIGALTNSGTLSGGSNGIRNSGTIGALTNSGTLSSGYNGIHNSGTIGALSNSGTITGSNAAIHNDATGTLDTVANTGVIAGMIRNDSTGNLTITGGTGTIVGTLTGVSGGIGASDRGIIGSSDADLVFASGNILLNSDVETGNRTLVNSANVSMLNNISLIDTTFQLLGGTLSGGTLTSDRAFDLRSGTVSSVLAGFVGLDKTTNGTVTLSGANTYTGVTTVSGGMLEISNGAALGDTTYGTTIAAGGSLGLSGGITVGAEALSIAGGGSGMGGALQNIGGDNTYTGAITLTSNSVIASHAGSLTLSGGVSGSLGLALGGAGNGTISSAITTGTGWIQKSGAGTWVLSDANTYTGTTQVLEGVLQVAHSAALGDTSAGTSVSDGATLRLLGDIDIDIGAEALTLNGAGATGTTGALQSVTGGNSYAGAITLATNSTIAVDAGTLTLSGALNGGSNTLSVAGAGGLILTGNATVAQTNIASGMALQIGDGGTTGSLSGSIVNDGRLVYNRSGHTTITNVISGSGQLIKLGNPDSRLYLTADNTYTGTTTVIGGILYVGNNGTTGSITGNVINNAGLAFYRSDDITYAGVISGTGLVGVGSGGTGTTTFTGNHTYAGGTQIENGTLQIGDGGTSGSIIGNVYMAAGTLAFDRSDAVTFAGVLSGTGALVQKGGDTLTFTGDSAFSGAITISSGTLQIGNGGTTGSLAGDIANNSALVFDRSNDLTYAGAISGSGTLTKRGAGTLTLTGTNALGGGTTITAGTLQIGNGGTTGSLSGAIANSGTLVFNRSDAVSAGAITGTGSLIQRGTGTLTLGGTNSAGGTTVEAGTLALKTGAQLTSDVQVLNGATLARTSGGTGTAQVNGTVTVANGGHIAAAPVGGSSYGLSVTTLVLNSGANLDVTLGTNVGAAAIRAQTLTLDGTLNVTNTGGMTFGTYRIIDYDTLAANNGLVLGAMPLGLDGVIQTSVANQINLVVDTTALFWNGSTTTADGTIHGGSGVWATGGATNWTNAAGIQAGAWPGGIAIFQGAPGAVTVDASGGAVSATAIQFGVDGYEIAGDTLTLANTSGRTGIRVGDGTATGAGYSATIGAVLAGTSGLDKQDLGTLVLTGTNIYTGGTKVTAGTLQIGDGIATGSILGDVENNANLVFNPGSALTYGGVISGTGSLFKQGSGTLTLTGDNTYTGGTSVTGGRLILSGGSSLSDSNGLIIGSAGTVELLDANETVGWLSGAGAVVLGANCLTVAGGGTTFSGSLTGTGCLNKTGTETLALTGTSTYSGGTTISGGTVQITDAAALGTGPLALSGTGTLQASGSFTFAQAISLAPVSGTGGGTLLVDDTRTLTLTGAIAGAGALDKTGAGTLVLGGTNTYGGDTNVMAGTLVATGGQAIGDSSKVSVASGAAFVVRGNETVGGLSGTGTLTLDGASLAITGNTTHTSVFNGAITGTGGLTKTGTGSLGLNGANTFTGTTTVSGGSLSVGGSLAGSVTVEDGAALFGRGTIAQNVQIQSGGMLTGSAGAGLTMGSLELADGASVTAALGAPGGSAVFNVTGDLTLDGTLNVRRTAGFGTGVYRIFNYGGALTDNGMSVGTLGGGYSGGMQSSIAGQVNLIVEDARTGILFWNGSQTTPTGTVAGGTGTWSAGAQTNWTNANGTIAHSWNDGFAVFQGTAGTVTVDNGSGQVATSGMQFVTSGYEVIGGAIALTPLDGSAPVIRVGDGTAGGANTYATIGAVLTGTAGLEKSDYGTLILTGANTYSGGTTISAGTLQLGDGSTNGSILGDVVNNGVLAFNNAGETSFAGTISGTGAVSVARGGKLTLTGANTYSGGTTVTNSTLQIAQAGALGTGGLTLTDATLQASGTFTYGGSVVLNSAPRRLARAPRMDGGTIAMDDTQALTLSGVISGAGDLTKTGEGLLILTGNNTYTGITTIEAGTLQIGNGGTTGSIVGDVVNNANLVFNRSDTYAFTGAITGTGAVAFKGGGTVLFSSPYSGAVAVDDTVVRLVSGSTTTSHFTVNDGGIIGGTATIGGMTVNAGGTAAPGYSPGTLTVSGPVTFNSGSVYLVDVTPAGAHDLITATGAVTLSSGASVRVNATPGVYAADSTLTILTTTGTLTGTFGGVTSNYAFLTPELTYDAQNVYLTLAYSGREFATLARTKNEVQTAIAAHALGAGNPVYDAILSLPATAVAPAFDQLSGEIYASVNTVIQQEAVYLRDAVGTRLRQSVTPAGGGALSYAANAAGPATAQLSRDLAPTLWMQGYGGWGTAFGDGNAASISSSTGGFLGGLDVGVADGVRAGVMAGFSQTHFSVGERSSSGSMDNYDLGLYAGGQFGAFALRGGLSYTWHDLSVSRTVRFPGFYGTTKGSDTVGTTQLFGEVAYGTTISGISLEPFAGLAYVNVSGGSLTETGVLMSGAGLNVDTGAMSTFYSTLGLRTATSMVVGGHNLTPSASIGWQHAFGDTTPAATMLFQGGTTPFQVSGVPIAENALLLGAGIGYDFSDVASLQVNYTGQLAGSASQNAFSAQFSLKF